MQIIMTQQHTKIKKVLVITYYWPPAGGPGVQRWLKFAKYLPTSEVIPVILTVDPHKAEYPIQDPTLQKDVDPNILVYKTTAKGLYSLYKKITHAKTAPYSGFVNEGKPRFRQKVARFIRGNFFLPDARKGWNKYAYAKAVELIEKYNIQTVITTGPPMSTHLIGLKLKKNKNIKWIADFRDPWTDIYYYHDLYPTRIAQAIDKAYEREVLEKSDIVLTANFIKEKLVCKSSKIIPEKIHVLTNGFDEEDFKTEGANKKEEFTITYAGTLASSYPVQPFIDAVAELYPEKKIVLQFVGKVSEEHKAYITSKKNIKAVFTGFIPHERAVRELIESQLLLLIFHHTNQNEGHMPGKLFEYLAARTPILCIEDRESMAGKIIRDCRSGITLSFHDKEGIKKFISTPYTQPEFQGDSEKISRYSRQTLTARLSQFID